MEMHPHHSEKYNMSYAINIEVDGFEFQFGCMGYLFPGLGAYINFYDPKIKTAIENKDPVFFEAIKSLLNESAELHALHTFSNFEYYYLQGNGWEILTTYHYSFDDLEKLKKQAYLVLESKRADKDQRKTAQTLLDVLSGNYKFPPPPEKSPEEKAKATFDRKRDKIRLKLVVRDGYKCVNCGEDKENSLCLTQKVKDPLNYELDNLHLKCRKCMRKK